MEKIRYAKQNGIAFYVFGDKRAFIRKESNPKDYSKLYRPYDAARNLTQLKNMVEVIMRYGYTPLIFDLGSDVPLRYEIHTPKNSPF